MATLFEQIFGWTQKGVKEDPPAESFTPEIKDDGAVVVQAGGAYGTFIDLDGTTKNDVELIQRYREMAMQPEVDRALDNIMNEAIITDEDYIVKIVLDKVEGLSDGIKKKIEAEFDHLLELLDFDTNAYEIFRKWYVDGRLYYHVIIDEKNQKNGIKEVRYIDPRKIRLVREVQEVKKDGYALQKTKAEYYVFNDRGWAATDIVGNQLNPTTTGIKITKDSICYVTSGITDQNNQSVLSHLNKAIKPLNSLRVLEDATVIYRIVRAPERRIFYIDVGNLPKAKAEQHVRDTMARHKNRVVYDQSTGEIRDDRKYMTMQEDYWFPRRDNGKATEVVTLPPGQNLGELTDVNYFKEQLYMALNIPTSRLQPDLGMTLGRATEISRDEVMFSHFVHRCRKRFAQLFLKLLEKQLVMRKIISPEDWPMISRKIEFDFVEDNHFAELKNLELLTGRYQALALIEPFIGKAISWKRARMEVLLQTEEDMEQIDKEMEEESKNPNLMTQAQLEIQNMQNQQEQHNASMDMQAQQLEHSKADLDIKKKSVEDADPYLGDPIESEDESEEERQKKEDEENDLGTPIKAPPGAKKDDEKKPIKGTKAKKPKSTKKA